MPSLTASTIEKLKHAPEMPGVLEIVLRRWSPRAFSSKDVSSEDLKRLFEAVRWASSSYNEQPWRFLVGRRGDDTYRNIFESLVEFNQSWAKSAPVLVLSVAKKIFTKNAAYNRFALHDTGAATANLALQATALGLHSHSMAGFDAEQARTAFSIPHDYEMGSVTAIGYLGDPSSLAGPLREREESVRERKPIHEIVFSSWEKPLSL